MFLPDTLMISVGHAAQATRVAVVATNLATDTVALATGGSAGGNAAGATAGAAGAAGGGSAISAMPRAGSGIINGLPGIAGIIGGTTVAGAALTIPQTGLRTTGGTGGGGLPAAAVAGTAGGAFTVTGAWPLKRAALVAPLQRPRQRAALMALRRCRHTACSTAAPVAARRTARPRAQGWSERLAVQDLTGQAAVVAAARLQPQPAALQAGLAAAASLS